jgi:prepilin-type N-terminal cleavage/methylation domain-containing protein
MGLWTIVRGRLCNELANMKAKHSSVRGGKRLAFTLVELLVVIAVIAILAALLLPALAGAKRRAKLAQCQNNFHQIYIACLAYANSYDDYFPICAIGNNGIIIPSDTSFVVRNRKLGALHPLPGNTPVSPNADRSVFDCLGFLYETHMIGDGKILYCPGFPETSLFGPARFSNPSFMSTDVSGWIQDSVLFNPQVVSVDPLHPNLARRFPKTSSLIPGRLFAMDALQETTNANDASGIGTTGVPTYAEFWPGTFAHYPSRGFDVLWTDGSVEYVQNKKAFKLASAGKVVDIDGWPYALDEELAGYQELYRLLESDH